MNHKYLNKISAVFLKTYLKTSRQAIFYGLISGLLLACPDSPATPTVVNNCASIINAGMIPSDFAGYDQASREIFSTYPAEAKVAVKYVVPNGSGDGSSTNNAAGSVKTILDGITDASANKVYVVLVAPGTYNAGAEMAMKNNVAIVGGGNCLGTGADATILSGGGTRRVFNNSELNNTALLYGVTIANGKISGNGAGMNNKNSSPTLIGINFFSNTATFGGGMYNENSSRPVLTRGSFISNTAQQHGGGMYNTASSPLLTGVAFSGNRAEVNGGGMYNTDSAPVLSSVTFSWNRGKASGGGMYSRNSSPVLIGVSFFRNGSAGGGGMYTGNYGSSSADIRLVNTILWSNVADGTTRGKEIHLFRDQFLSKILLYLYNSVLEGGIPINPNTGVTYKSGTTVATLDGVGIRATAVDISADTKVIFTNIITNYPGLNTTLADNGGGTLTHAIPTSSPAVDAGLYVRRSAAPTGTGCVGQCDRYTYYYSIDNSNWYSNPELTTTATLPTDAVDLTATDATGYRRSGRPDIGAYEAR